MQPPTHLNTTMSASNECVTKTIQLPITVSSMFP